MSEPLIHVLLIEDSPSDALLLEDALAQVNPVQFRVSQAERLTGAQEQLSHNPFDVVLLDLGLPDSQGLEALLKIREQTPHMPIVVLTGLADEVLGLSALHAGAQDYLVKGQVEGEGLARAMRYAIERQQAEQALRASEAFNRAVFSSLKAHIAVLDGAGQIIAVNEAWEAFARTNGDPHLRHTGPGINYLDVCRKAATVESRTVLSGIQAVSVGLQPQFGLEYGCHSPAEKRWFHLQVTPLQAQAGQVVVAHENITQQKQAEEALTTERQRLRTLIDNLPDHIFLKDTAGRFIIGNVAVAQAMGATSPEALVGKTDLDFYPPELAAEYHANEQAVIQSGQPVFNREEPLLDASGKQGWLSTTQVPLRDSRGQIVGLVGVSQDITRRKQREEELYRRNRDLSLLNQIIAACAANPETETLLEIACRELALAFEVPQSTAALLNDTKTSIQIVAEYRAEGRTSALGLIFPVVHDPALQYLLKHEGPLIVNEPQRDPRLVASFREMLRQSGVASLLILPLRLSGEVVGSLTIEASEPRLFSTQDINLAWSVADQIAGTLTHTRLSQIQQRLSAAIEQAAESVIITDTNGLITYVNPAFEHISGYNRVEVLGQPLNFLKSGQHEASFYQELWATITAGQVWRGRFINRRKDGSLYTEEAIITPVYNESETIVSYVSVQRDMSRELQLEEQYHQAQKMEAIGRLSGGVAHDFNNLLVVITGYSELLLNRHLEADDPLRKYVEEIQKAGERAARLTQQMLAFSRKQVLQPKILTLNDIVSPMETMLRRLIGEDIDLITKLRPGLGPVKADPSQIEQIVLNLVINARDAMPRGGKIIIETANIELDSIYTRQHSGVSPGWHTMLAVSDTGQGMDAETVAHIFEPFFTTKAQGKGTGLGLATVYGIVKQSGGDIWVYSEPERGTTFKIYFPQIGEKVSAAEPQPALAEGGHETVLLVEDEIGVRSLARQVLELGGYTVLEAAHGREALLLCEQCSGRIDLLLTDVVMPGGLNGRELAKKAGDFWPTMKVLYMSGYTDDAIIHHGVLESGQSFLQKPFTPNNLLQKVREVLDAA